MIPEDESYESVVRMWSPKPSRPTSTKSKRPSTAQSSRASAQRSRPGSAISLSARPVWRPNGHRPEWPIAKGLAKEQALARLRSPPREAAASPKGPGQEEKSDQAQATGAVLSPRPPPAALMLSSWEMPRPLAKMKRCELRELPEMKSALLKVKQEEMPHVCISRKLNWPPRGWVLEQQVMDSHNRVLLMPRSEPRRHKASPRTNVTRSTYVSSC